MPYLPFTASIPAGQSLTPLSNWQFRQPNFPGTLEVYCNATATGCVQSLVTGSESIVQADISAVGAGGSPGVMPAAINTVPIVDGVLPGEEIVHSIRNTTAGAITVNVVYVLTPSK